jgi:FemAB-related protein (PEP-CTERM system-associated)
MVEPTSLRGAGEPRTDEFAPTGVTAAATLPVACVVRPFMPQDRLPWNTYVQEHPEGTFFHLAEWAGVLERAFGHQSHYLLAERAGEVVGVLPLAEVRSLLFGHALVSTPFCVYGGVLAADESAVSALERAACELGERLGVSYIEMRNRRPVHKSWLTKDLYVTFRRPLAADAEGDLRASPRSRRRGVRKAQDKGLRAEVDADTARLYSIYSESLRNLGTPVFTRRYPAILQETFGNSCDVLTVVSGSTAVASVMNFYFRDEVMPYYAGSIPVARELAAYDFLYWHVMERARRRGARVFDFGRSRQGSGSFEFKVHWGFVPETLAYQYLLVRATAMPNLSPSNSQYQRLIGVWRYLPLPVTRWIGPPLARYLG